MSCANRTFLIPQSPLSPLNLTFILFSRDSYHFIPHSTLSFPDLLPSLLPYVFSLCHFPEQQTNPSTANELCLWINSTVSACDSGDRLNPMQNQRQALCSQVKGIPIAQEPWRGLSVILGSDMCQFIPHSPGMIALSTIVHAITALITLPT